MNRTSNMFFTFFHHDDRLDYMYNKYIRDDDVSFLHACKVGNDKG